MVQPKEWFNDDVLLEYGELYCKFLFWFGQSQKAVPLDLIVNWLRDFGIKGLGLDWDLDN